MASGHPQVASGQLSVIDMDSTDRSSPSPARLSCWPLNPISAARTGNKDLRMSIDYIRYDRSSDQKRHNHDIIPAYFSLFQSRRWAPPPSPLPPGHYSPDGHLE